MRTSSGKWLAHSATAATALGNSCELLPPYRCSTSVAFERRGAWVSSSAVQPSSVWCDRQGAELRRLAITLPESAPTAHYTHDWNTPLPTAKSVALHSKLPVWNRQLGCLSLHFGRKRVRASSSKNFLVYTTNALRDPKKRDDAEAAVFQLGKLAPKTFALDFRHPLSALQAFAVALAAFRVKHSRGVPRISRAEAESN